jgi:uncharacterized protein (TIGR00730 family)
LATAELRDEKGDSMADDTRGPTKAYKNLEFLSSPAARSIRVMCELTEPEERLEREKVHGTIVFFGSARILPRADANARLKTAAERLTAKPADSVLLAQRAVAERAVKMSRYYEDAAELGRRLTEWAQSHESPGDAPVVCTGGGPGIMEAANRGAHAAGGRSIGMNISLPFEQHPNIYQSPELSFEFHYFFVRKFWLFYPARALVIFPGGFGTFDEMFELLTLIQTEKAEGPLPIVVYGSEYWRQVVDFDALVEWGTISPHDLDLMTFCDDVPTAFSFLTEALGG